MWAFPAPRAYFPFGTLAAFSTALAAIFYQPVLPETTACCAVPPLSAWAGSCIL